MGEVDEPGEVEGQGGGLHLMVVVVRIRRLIIVVVVVMMMVMVVVVVVQLEENRQGNILYMAIDESDHMSYLRSENMYQIHLIVIDHTYTYGTFRVKK